MDLLDISGISLLALLAVGAFGLSIVALIAVVYPKLRNRDQGYPHEKLIEAILLPWIYNAIIAAYKVSEFTIDEIQQRMRGADKAAIAMALYDMLPNKIGNVSIAVIKTMISRERFGQLVQIAFSEFDEFFEGKESEFKDLLDKWLQDNRPIDPLIDDPAA